MGLDTVAQPERDSRTGIDPIGSGLRSAPQSESRRNPAPDGAGARGSIHTNTIEGGFFSIFKRGMRGIYQHCREKHLHRYLAEFDFRYSNRIALGCGDLTRADRILSGFVGKRLWCPNETRTFHVGALAVFGVTFIVKGFRCVRSHASPSNSNDPQLTHLLPRRSPSSLRLSQRT